MSRESLKEATLTGVRWVMLARWVTDVLALGVAVALARLLPPAEFGRAAVALIFVPLAAIITYEGFASALVQRRSFDESHRRAAALSSVLGGAALSAIVFLAARPVGEPIFGREIAELIVLVSPVFLIASVGAVSRATLLRRLDFRRTSLIEIASLVSGNAVALGLALDGVDAGAIVAGGLAHTAVAAALLVASAPPPLPRWHARSQREISAFGIPAAAAGLVHVMFQNVDYAILAARLTAGQAGIYWRAFNLGVVHQDKVSGVMMQVAFPVYSRADSREELRRIHTRATRVLAAAIFPLLMSLVVFAGLLIPFVYGAAWEPAVVPAQILAVAGMIAAILTGYPQVMLALGRPKTLLRFNVAMLGVYAVAVALASGQGLVAVSVAVVGVYVAILLSVYHFLLGRHLDMPLAVLKDHLGPSLACCAALALVALPAREAFVALGAPAPLTIAVAGSMGLLAYGAAMRLLFPHVWSDVRLLIERVVPPLARASGRIRRGARRRRHAGEAPPRHAVTE